MPVLWAMWKGKMRTHACGGAPTPGVGQGCAVPPLGPDWAASEAPAAGVTDVRGTTGRGTLKVSLCQTNAGGVIPSNGRFSHTHRVWEEAKPSQTAGTPNQPMSVLGLSLPCCSSEIVWRAGAEWVWEHPVEPAGSQLPLVLPARCGSSAQAPAATQGHSVPCVTPKAREYGQ